MVLKNSNSHFNSGATQRLCNRGAIKMQYSTESSPLTLSITLKGLPRVLDEDNPSNEHVLALEKLYDYLDFPGPGLKVFYDSPAIHVWDRTERALSFSLNKNELWNLPEKFDNLMKEVNFVEGKQELAEIRAERIIKIADRNYVYRKESHVLYPKPMKKVDKSNKDKVGCNTRGLQRRHLLVRQQDGEENEENENLFSKKVVIELQEKDHIDSRTLNCKSDTNPRIDRKMMGKALCKTKGNINGKGSHFVRGYNPSQIEREKEDIVSECMNSNSSLDDLEDFDYSADELEDYRNVREDVNENWAISTKKHRSKKKRLKCKNNVSVCEEQFTNVNTASSQSTLKHPKGSYQIIDKPCNEIEVTRNVSSDDDFVEVDGDEIREINSGVQDVDLTPHKANLNIPFTPETFDSYDDFVKVNLSFPDHIKDNMLDSKCYTFTSNGCSVVLGNCFPPVFCVNLQDDDCIVDNGWRLIGVSFSSISSNQDFQWEITLKSNTANSANEEVKDDFFCRINSMNDNDLFFDDFVKMALVSIRLGTIDLLNYENMFKPTCKDIKKRLCDSDHNNSHDIEIFSIDNALKTLEALYKTNANVIDDTNPTAIPDTVNSESTHMDVECDICFVSCDKYGQDASGLITLLPCKHSFCYECWKSHIFYHVINGDTGVKCMHTECDQLLNDAILNSIVPEKYLIKLHTQRKEKHIDMSPLCQWCPKSKCDRVAVIKDQSPHVQQFGRSVVCDCKSSWCFACQSDPHWPISCGQAAAYRKLLYKVNNEMPSIVTCNVDLKPCPGCKYPIEKNQGCPHMICRMCHFNFCWNCLQSTERHRVWECMVDETSTFVTYQLHNDVINSFPLKFFSDAIDMKKKYKNIKKASIHGWLHGLLLIDPRKLKQPFHKSVQLENAEVVKDQALRLASESVSFLSDSFSFLEYFYIVLSFALLNKETEKKTYHIYLERLINRLLFTTTRLEESVVGKSLRQLSMARTSCQMYLTKGSEILDKLKNNVTLVQKLSRDVPAQPIGELDPKKYYRYK